jgi:hypothetical protein
MTILSIVHSYIIDAFDFLQRKRDNLNIFVVTIISKK